MLIGQASSSVAKKTAAILTTGVKLYVLRLANFYKKPHQV